MRRRLVGIGFTLAAAGAILGSASNLAIGLKKSRLLVATTDIPRGLGPDLGGPAITYEFKYPTGGITADDDILLEVRLRGMFVDRAETVRVTVSAPSMSVAPEETVVAGLGDWDANIIDAKSVLSPKSAGRKFATIAAVPSSLAKFSKTETIEFDVDAPSSTLGISKQRLADLQAVAGILGTPGILLILIGRWWPAGAQESSDRKRCKW